MSTFDDVSVLQIRVFIAVAECKSITTAAKMLFISQSSASRLVQKLEENIKVPLFQRNNHGVELTESGEYLYRQLKPLNSNLLASFYNITQTASSGGRTVCVACLDFAEPIDVLSSLIKQFNKVYPDIPVDVRVCNVFDLREGMISGKYDCAFSFISASRDLPENMEIRYYKHMESFFALAADNAAIEGDRLNYSILANSTLYTSLYAQHDVIRARALSICASHGFTPRNVQYCANEEAIAEVLQRTDGFAVTGSIFGIGTALRKFKTEMPLEEEQYLTMIWKPEEASPATRRFVESIPCLQVSRAI